MQDLNNNDNNELDFFDSPWTTIVRIFAMFVGELDFSDIPIDPSKTFSVVSYVFFLIFVLTMVVILMNLLNGLAVADVGEIVRDAKVVSIKSRYQSIRIFAKAQKDSAPIIAQKNWSFASLQLLFSISLCIWIGIHAG